MLKYSKENFVLIVVNNKWTSEMNGLDAHRSDKVYKVGKGKIIKLNLYHLKFT